MQKDLERKFLLDFEANQNIVHKICRIYTTNKDAHNDLFQEITIQVWKNYLKFRGDSKFKVVLPNLDGYFLKQIIMSIFIRSINSTNFMNYILICFKV